MSELVDRVDEAMGAAHNEQQQVRRSYHTLEADLLGAVERADKLQRQVEGMELDMQVLSDSYRGLQAENSNLRAHAGRLVELLSDAWWVEAADHLQALRKMTTPGEF